MPQNPTDPLANSIWQALHTSHRQLAIASGQACRYPQAVAPFAAVDENTPSSLEDLAQLLQPGEAVYLMGERPLDTAALRCDGIVACLQMAFPADAPLPPEIPGLQVEPLDCRDAQEMLDLIAVAFPGYFRPETCRMGRYFGIRDPEGHLIAMGGERLVLALPNQPAWREISGLCSRPDQAGRGLGTVILRRILADHRAEGSISWLHVTETNHKAISLYRRLGFQSLRRVELHRLQRASA